MKYHSCSMAAAAVLIYCIVQAHIAGGHLIPAPQTETADNNLDDTGRLETSADVSLEAFRETLLELLNQYRQEKNLPFFEVDQVLESGAQAWAAEETTTLTMRHSCEECQDYAEILGKRRSSRLIPQGVAASDWVYRSLFADDEERTYASITDDPQMHTVGFGIAFIRNAEDGVFHAFVVSRFARAHHSK